MLDPSTFAKAQRLTRLSYWLYRHPAGLTATEIARLSGVSARTAQRDLHDLEEAGIPLWEDENASPPRYGILDGYYLPPVHLTFDDAVSLYLAARLLARHADTYDPHIAEALAKLAVILPESLARHVHASIADLVRQPSGDVVVGVLSTLALGWATGRKVRIHHLASTSDAPSEHTLCPYLLEPSGPYQATYVIGLAEDVGELRTFKVERITAAELLEETFEPPPDFDGPALLRQCWGIMYGGEVEEVRLRFAPSARRRLRETVWHPSMRLCDLEDGGCELCLTLTNPREMRYWILGWGAQVEVLAPEWLREDVAEQARGMARLYEEGA